MNTTLPPVRTGPSAWYGPQMEQNPTTWIIKLKDEEIKELELAAHAFTQSKWPIAELNEHQFPLPSLGPKLKRIRQQLINGIGFTLIKGLVPEQYTKKELAIMFFGLGTHIGHARSQNAMGHVLGHVKNLNVDSSDPNVRLYQTKERQTFHTDSCDVVGLLCVQPAQQGGLSLLVSADTVFNEMHKRRPDLLQLLLEPIGTDRRGEVPEGQLPYMLIPVFSHYEGRITPFYQRQYIESSQRFPDAPRLTPQHFEALDLFDELCNDPNLHLSMMLEKGDMQFVYNHAMLHDRTGFVDHPESEKRRHLMRLWLSVPDDRPLPNVFASRYGTTEIGNRGGIIVPGSELCFPGLD
ncbi:MAG: TauD/TfdA family dioxygenase [Bacteroidota bacterium]